MFRALDKINNIGWLLLNPLKKKQTFPAFYVGLHSKTVGKFPAQAYSVTQMCRCVEIDTWWWTLQATNKVAAIHDPNWNLREQA